MTETLNVVDPNTRLTEAQQWLRSRVEDGAACPCCSQYAKVYRRKITATTAASLILIHRHAGNDWVHLPTVVGRRHADEAKARYWGLIEEWDGEREDGSKRNGHWRLTPRGTAFVLGRVRVPKYARIYDGRLLGLDDSETVSIEDALGTRFNYRELMEGV